MAQRLPVVRAAIAAALDAAPARPLRALSLCAGDGRDLIPLLQAHPRGGDVTAVLVEQDERLAERAGQSARGLPGVAVRTGDASRWAEVLDAGPADLLLICGVFGNIRPSDVATTVWALPWLLAPGSRVVWTCKGRPSVQDGHRRLFATMGFDEVSFHDGAGQPFGVGVATPRSVPSTPWLGQPDPVFSFVR